MVIGIDIDDTIVKTRELQKEFWKEYVSLYPTNEYTEIIPESINRFGDPYINTFWDLYRDKMFFPEVKEGVVEVINKLRSENNSIVIITSRPTIKYNNLVERIYNELINNGIIVDDIMVDVKNKGLFMLEHNIDLLIDDDIINIESAQAYGKVGILFNMREEYEGYQTNSWYNIYEMINNIKEYENESKSKENIKVRKL